MKITQMKQNVLLIMTLFFFLSFGVNAQRGVSIAYIDSEYILENVPEYQEAMVQLNTKADKWKIEIAEKINALKQKRINLSNEKALLTNELAKEREEYLDFEENEILDYQQKRFGPNGDLFIQKKQLMQPIQDQIFAAVQTIVASRKFDIVLDKANGGMIYVANQLDISDMVLRSITRASKRQQATSKSERKSAEAEDIVPVINRELEAREKAAEEKQEQRESAIEKARQKRLEEREARVKELEEKRQKILEEREKAKQAKLAERNQQVETATDSINSTRKNTETKEKEAQPEETKTRAQIIEENRQKKLEQRRARIKELEERKKKILEQRQKAKDSVQNKN